MPITPTHFLDGTPLNVHRWRAVTPVLLAACAKDGIDLESLTAAVLGRRRLPSAELVVSPDTAAAVKALRANRRATTSQAIHLRVRQARTFRTRLLAAKRAHGVSLPAAWVGVLVRLIADVEVVIASVWTEPGAPSSRLRQPRRALVSAERRLFGDARRQLAEARSADPKMPSQHGVPERAAEYAFVILSLNGPGLYPAAAHELIAVLKRLPGAANIIRQIDSLRHRVNYQPPT